MTEIARPPPDKFARYRARRRSDGLKLVRIWAPDPNAPGFQDRLDAQLRAARDSDDERDVMDWIEAVSAELVLDPYDDPELETDVTNPPR